MTRTCSTCQRKHYAKGLCRKHYDEQYLKKPETKAWRREYERRPEVKARKAEYARRPEVKVKRREYCKKYVLKNHERLKKYYRAYARKPHVLEQRILRASVPMIKRILRLCKNEEERSRFLKSIFGEDKVNL